jgi:hypothetical protein
MIRRFAWFAAGTVAGAAGGLYGRRKVVQAAERLAPTTVARRTVASARARGRDVVDAMREGRAAMRAKEAELRAAAEGHPVVTTSAGPVVGPTTPVPTGGVVEVRVVEHLDDYRARRELPPVRRRRRR